MEGAGENSSWPTGGATNPFGHGWNRKMNGLSVVEAGSSGQKTLADVTEEWNKRIDEMHGRTTNTRSSQDLFFSWKKPSQVILIPSKVSWMKRHSGLGILSQPRELSSQKENTPFNTHAHTTLHLISLWFASFLLLLPL